MNYKKVLIGSLSAVALLGTSLLPVFADAENVTKEAKLSATVPAGKVSFNTVNDLSFGEGDVDLINHMYTFNDQNAHFKVDNSTGIDTSVNISVSSTVDGFSATPTTVHIDALSSKEGDVATSLKMRPGAKTVDNAIVVYTLTPVTGAE